MKVLIIFILYCISTISSFGQLNDWKDAKSVSKCILQAQEVGKSYFSQFHEYDVRGNDIHTSIYRDHTGETPYIYGLDFYYASGSYFSEKYKHRLKGNIIAVVKKQWEENRSIPSFSWHLENPYVTNDFGKYMGCTYRYGQTQPLYPEAHRYVITEILTGKNGEECGLGSFQQNNDIKIPYKNPKYWFEARCKEVADIINQFVDSNGKPIPLILRLWHECEDTWMWWGSQSVSTDDYKKFFIYTVNTIKKYAPKAQILWAYCPDRYWNDEEEYLSRYPGDRYVDIMGYDDYSIGVKDKTESVIEKARIVSRCAQKHSKIAALFETANKTKDTSDVFFTDYLLPLLQTSGVKLGLVQMWTSGQFDTQAQFEDRKIFLKSPNILVLNSYE